MCGVCACVHVWVHEKWEGGREGGGRGGGGLAPLAPPLDLSLVYGSQIQIKIQVWVPKSKSGFYKLKRGGAPS